MAILTTAQLRTMRYNVATKAGMRPAEWTRQTLTDVFQALEDWYQANKASAASDMESAAPGVFSTAQKKEIGDTYFDMRLG